MTSNYRTLWAAAGVLCMPALALAGFPVTLESVVNHADTVADVPGATWIAATGGPFQVPSIDNAGNVAFLGRIAGDGITTANDTGYWFGAPGFLSMITRLGDAPLPGSGGTAYTARQRTSVPMSPSGHMWIGGTVSAGNGVTTGQNDRVVWTGQSGSMTKFTARTDVAPGTASTFNSSVDSTSNSGAALNNAGQSIVSSALVATPTNGITTGVNDSGLWIGTPSGLTKVVQRGDQAPDQPAGQVLGSLSGWYHNGSAEVAFTGGLAIGVGGVTTSNDAALWTNVGGTMRVAAREGAASAIAGVDFGVSTSTLFPFFQTARQALNNDGLFLYGAALGTGSTTADNFALFADDGSSSQALKRKGDAAPDVAGATLNAISMGETRINNDGLFAWVSSMAGTAGGTADDRALWLSAVSGGDTLIVQESDPAPGIAGALMGEPVNVLLNNTGTVVFTSVLKAGFGGVTTANDRTIWGWREDVGLQLIAREGDTLFGTLMSNFGYSLDPNAEGGAVALSDTGWLTFNISGGSGASATGAVIRTMVPEPASLALLALGGLAVARRRR